MDTSVRATCPSLRNDDTSIALQYFLETEVPSRETPVSIGPADFLDILLSAGGVVQDLAGREREMPSDRDYLARVAQVAYERHNAGRLVQDVPVLSIIPTPVTEPRTQELLGNNLNYVVILGLSPSIFRTLSTLSRLTAIAPGELTFWVRMWIGSHPTAGTLRGL